MYFDPDLSTAQNPPDFGRVVVIVGYDTPRYRCRCGSDIDLVVLSIKVGFLEVDTDSFRNPGAMYFREFASFKHETYPLPSKTEWSQLGIVLVTYQPFIVNYDLSIGVGLEGVEQSPTFVAVW